MVGDVVFASVGNINRLRQSSENKRALKWLDDSGRLPSTLSTTGRA